jgi:hypothetical protein
MQITAKGIATPIPAFAPVERPVEWRLVSTGSGVAVGKYVLTLEIWLVEKPVAVLVIRTVCMALTQEAVIVIVEGKTSASEVDA